MTQRVEKRKQIFKIRDSQITVFAEALVDDVTGEIVSDFELDDAAIKLAMDKYRQQNGTLYPEEIVGFRKKLGLSQRQFAKFIGIGPASIARYEMGAIPSESINNLLKQLIQDKSTLLNFFENNEEKLKKSEIESVSNYLQTAVNTEIGEPIQTAYLDITSNKLPNLEDGFNSFDFEKYKNVILFFLSNDENLSKFKLNNLLFYADFSYFGTNSISITGAVYYKNHFGFAPKNYELLLDAMENERLIDIFPTENYLGENIKLLDSPDIGILNNEELKALEKVRQKFQNFDNQKIIEYSERREVWKNSELREAIDYQPLFELE